MKSFEKHKDSLIRIYLPTESPEFMCIEESWNISKNALYINSFHAFLASIACGKEHID